MLGPVVLREGGALQTLPLGAVLAHLNGEIDIVDESAAAARREAYNARRRERRADDPAFHEREKAGKREAWSRASPEYRERQNARCRERWATDPAFRAKKRERDRERYRNDPAFAERKRAARRASRLRTMADPVAREAYNARRRERRAAMRAAAPVDPMKAEVEAFVAWTVAQGSSEYTAERRKAALRAYFRFCAERGAPCP